MTIRARLTIWNTVVIAILTSILGASTYWATSLGLSAAVNRDLEDRVRGTESMVAARFGDKLGALPPDMPTFSPEAGPGNSEAEVFIPRVFIADGSSRPFLGSKPWDSAALAAVRRTKTATFSETFLPTGDKGLSVRARVYTAPLNLAPELSPIAQVAVSLRSLEEETARLGRLLMLLVPLSWAAALAAGSLLTHLALKPVRRLATDAQLLLKGNPTQRLPAEDPDEMGDLAKVINQGLDRTEEGYRRLERFVADASHELKSPLTAILLRATSAKPNDLMALNSNMSAIRDSAKGMKGIIDDLLLAARLDDQGAADFSKVDLVDIAEEAWDLMAPSFGERLRLESSEEAWISAEPGLIRRLALNLLGNAERHAGARANVLLRVYVEADSVCLSVEDDGVGIEREHLPRIFERFYRADSARTHSEDWQGQGSGLGLAIVQSIANIHGAKAECWSELDRGTKVTVRFPRWKERSSSNSAT